MKKMHTILITGVVAIVLVVGAAYTYTRNAVSPTLPAAHQTIVTLGDTKVVADIADTDALRAQGLSGRSKLDDLHGMLFVFQYEGYPTFWMKDMLIPIDMLWLSSDKKVVYVVPNATPESYPATFKPDEKARYVLEVAAGWAARHSIEIGSSASF